MKSRKLLVSVFPLFSGFNALIPRIASLHFSSIHGHSLLQTSFECFALNSRSLVVEVSPPVGERSPAMATMEYLPLEREAALERVIVDAEKKLWEKSGNEA